MGDAEDFWPVLEDAEDPNAPVVLLRKQAEKLTEKTGYRLRGRVSTSSILLDHEGRHALGLDLSGGANPDSFTHVFTIEVPALDDYSYTLFSVSHGIEPYPVIYPDAQGGWNALANHEAFTAWLRETLASERTKRVLKTLSEQAGR